MTTVAQRRRRIGWSIGLAFAGAIIGMVIGWLSAVEYAGQRDEARTEQQEAKVTADSALNYMRSACSTGDQVACDYIAKLSALPDPPPGRTGPAGPPGPVGPVGPQGPQGARGITGMGRPGADGRDGVDGVDGVSIEGPAGPTGPAGPQGPQGPVGPSGSNGTDGRGIRDLQCGDDGRWTVTYTDGTTSDAGLCRAAPGNSGENR